MPEHDRRGEDHRTWVGWLLKPARRIYVGVLYLILCVIIAFLAMQYERVRNDEKQLAAGLAAQTQNRTSNVGAWCGAINQLDRSLTGYVDVFVAADSRIPRLHLHLLPCTRLERRTLASTKPH